MSWPTMKVTAVMMVEVEAAEGVIILTNVEDN